MAHTRETYPLQRVAVCRRLLQCVAVHRREIHPLRAKHVHTPCAALLLHVLHSSGSHRIPNRRCGSLVFFFVVSRDVSSTKKNRTLTGFVTVEKKPSIKFVCEQWYLCTLCLCASVHVFMNVFSFSVYAKCLIEGVPWLHDVRDMHYRVMCMACPIHVCVTCLFRNLSFLALQKMVQHAHDYLGNIVFDEAL